jgi:hypothetical protein
MTRHASTDELANLAVGELGRRKAAKITAHVAVCTRCTHVSRQLAEVPAVLSGASYPELPETVSVRVQAAIRVEVNHRLGEAPATEAGRRDLPARSRRHRAGGLPGGWHLPGLSVAATRLVAAAGAVVVVGAGGYLVASNVQTGATRSPSSSAALPAPAQPMRVGANVTYGSPGAQHTVHSVDSSTDFVPAQLRSQALSAYHEAELKGAAGSQPSGSANTPNGLGQPRSSAASGSGAAGPGRQLAGCIDAVGPGRTVLLVDHARYLGSPATIIIFGSSGTSQAEVVVAASSCSATAPDVLARAPLGHL